MNLAEQAHYFNSLGHLHILCMAHNCVGNLIGNKIPLMANKNYTLRPSFQPTYISSERFKWIWVVPCIIKIKAVILHYKIK